MTGMMETLDGRTVFVAGASGLAGSSVVRALLAANPTVRVRAGRRGDGGAVINDPRVEYVRGDLRNDGDCRRLVKGCDWAVLTAANTGGAAQAVSEPWQQVTDNIVMDAQVLQALHAEGVRRAVYVSSATVYPDGEAAIAEDALDWNRDPAPAQFGIGWAKRAAEKLCRFWHDATGMEIVIARAANIYGPFAKFDPQRANFIPALIRKAAAGMDPFEVWGAPEVTRDVLYADDFAAGVVALLGATGIAFDVFNLGSGRGATVGDVVDRVLRHAGHAPSSITWRGGAPTTARCKVLDCARIEKATGWRVAVDLDEGIRRTVAWWQQEGMRWNR
jgi:GDP-L-fucose synthase